MTTKEKIVTEALELFSVHGFEGVSMRDIGAAVGIRESSIYKHYSGKQAILDAIVAKAMEEIDQLLVKLNVPDSKQDASVARYTEMKFEDIAELCSKMILVQMDNDLIRKFRQLVTIEQYRNEELRRIYIEMFMERQLLYNEKVFDYLLKIGVLKGNSPRMMALEFFAPFFLLQYRYDTDREVLAANLKEHAVTFIKEHLKED